MNKKITGMAKKILAGFVSAAMIVTMLPQIPVFAKTGATTYSYDGYDVEYSVLNEWDNGQTVQVKITNTGDESILNWALKYNAEGTISNLWNAMVYDNRDEDYIIKNSGWNYEIAPGQAVDFGYTLVGEEFDVPDKFDLCLKRVEMKDGFETALKVIEQWNTGMKAEIVITNTSDKPIEAWTYSFDGNFTIDNLWDARLLESTDNHYSIASEMWTNPISAGDSKAIGFTASVNGEVTPEISNGILTAVEIDNLEAGGDDGTADTDGDGLSDADEKNIYETDINNPDTDGDGLPDGYEVITLHTNPALKDTDDNGTTDDEEDFDADDLTNYKEYLLGTDPYKADTDGDGLTDGDEVNRYDTDPLKYDTDGDGVIDSDEILLGLAPNDPADGDTVIKQSINEKELRVNRYNEDFKISIDVEASNNVKRFISQGISRYKGILSDNKAIVGLPVCIKYDAGTIKSGTITFRLDNKFVEGNSHFYPELGLGIDRYGIFCYDKEVRTIVPLPCKYDEENKTITIDARYMGDLMIIDYESLMFDLGVHPETAADGVPAAASLMEEEFDDAETEDHAAEPDCSSNEVTDFEDFSREEIEKILESGEEDEKVSVYSVSPKRAAAKSSAMRQVDLVLVVDTTGSMGSQIATVKRNLSTLISKLREEGISLYVSIVDYRDITCDGKDSTKVNNNSGKDFYNSLSDITNVISSLYPAGGGDGPETAIDGLARAYNLSYRESSAKFAFLITDAGYKNQNNHGIEDMAQMADMLKQKGIRTSVVTTASYYKTYESLAETADGDMFLMTGDFCDEMFGFICYGTPKMNVVIADNIVSGYFKEPLVKGGDCDTDGDTLSDSEEVDWYNVKEVLEDGTYELYTWKELCQKSRLWFLEVEDYAGGESNPLFELMGDIEVIPATSNPFSADTDKDYYPDNKDEDILDTNPMYIYDAGINDSGFHKGVSVAVKESDKYTDGKLTVNNSEGTAKYSFTRRPGDFAYFTLKPDAVSFYKFTNKANAAASVTVSYEKGWGLWEETVYVDPDSNGTYLLERGKEYTIEIYGDGYSDYGFTAEQDNWVYAPDGGVWEANDGEPLSEYKPIKQYYITPRLFVDSLYTNVDNDFEITTIYTQKDLKNVMKSLEPELRSKLTKELGDFIAEGGSVIWLANKVTHEKVKILRILGDVLVICGIGIDGVVEMENLYIEHIEDVLKEGNLHICYSTYMTKFYNNYTPWTIERYIRKIQYNIAGSVNDSLSYKTVQDACGFPNFDNR